MRTPKVRLKPPKQPPKWIQDMSAGDKELCLIVGFILTYFAGTYFPILTIVNMLWHKPYSIQVAQMPDRLQIACLEGDKTVASGIMTLTPEPPAGVTK